MNTRWHMAQCASSHRQWSAGNHETASHSPGDTWLSPEADFIIHRQTHGPDRCDFSLRTESDYAISLIRERGMI